jgi:hypothetical protein
MLLPVLPPMLGGIVFDTALPGLFSRTRMCYSRLMSPRASNRTMTTATAISNPHMLDINSLLSRERVHSLFGSLNRVRTGVT